ncbi:unnamed protein product [Allacma fusca]|uniref:Uncharacterized protein n=1 Tax=Allacma fusca TaxID=39272 RepID=A0A8J2JGJ6_9HEXA|nr:unnamed protein product [Allacma fusca]
MPRAHFLFVLIIIVLTLLTSVWTGETTKKPLGKFKKTHHRSHKYGGEGSSHKVRNMGDWLPDYGGTWDDSHKGPISIFQKRKFGFFPAY